MQCCLVSAEPRARAELAEAAPSLPPSEPRARAELPTAVPSLSYRSSRFQVLDGPYRSCACHPRIKRTLLCQLS